MKEEKRWFLEGSQHPIPKDVCEKHKTPSPQTVEEINNIKVNFARMEEKLDNLINLVEGHIVKHESDTQDMREKIEPVLNAINTAGSLKKALLGFAAVVLAIAGSIAGIKSIIGYFSIK